MNLSVRHRCLATIVAAGGLLLALTGSAQAATNPACPAGSVYWVGGHLAPGDTTPNNWQVAANWSDDAEPTSTTNVCLDNTDASGSYAVNIDFYNNIDANSITIGGGPGNTVTLALLGSGGGVQTGDELHLTNESAGGGVTPTGAITLGSSPAGLTGGQPGLIDVMAGTLVNQGTITSEPYNGQNANTINGGLDNEGTLNVTDSLNLNGPDLNGTGTINIAAGNELHIDLSQTQAGFTQTGGTINNQGTFLLADGTFTASAGTSTGNPLMVTSDNSGVDINLAGSATDSLHAQTGGANLTGNIGTGNTLWSSGEPGYTQGGLNVQGAYTNYGTLELGAGGTDNTQGNVFAKNGTFTNAGTLISENTISGGPNGINGPLANTGNLSLQESIDGAGLISNEGTLALAQGMTISAASFAQTAPGALSVDLQAGSSALQNPVLNLSGAADLGGGLGITTSGTQTANVTLVKAASVSGTFPAPSFAGQSYALVYAPTTVTLSPGASTTTSPPTTTPPATARPDVRGVSGRADGLSVKLSCPTGHAACSVATVRATVLEKVKGRKAKAKVVTVGSAKASLAAGSSRVLTVKLNKAGVALLKGHKKLQVTVTITAGGKVIKKTKINVTGASSRKKGKKN